MSARATYDFPIMGVANRPDADARLLRDDMNRVLGPVKELLIRRGVNFDQALAIYNDIPVLLTAADLAKAELQAIIARHTEVA